MKMFIFFSAQIQKGKDQITCHITQVGEGPHLGLQGKTPFVYCRRLTLLSLKRKALQVDRLDRKVLHKVCSFSTLKN